METTLSKQLLESSQAAAEAAVEAVTNWVNHNYKQETFNKKSG